MTDIDLKLRVTMKSDWHTGSGEGLTKDIDSAVVRDAAGLPFIPAKTTTGVLRERAEQVAEALDADTGRSVWHDWARWVFGSRPDREDSAGGGSRPRPQPAALVTEPLRLTRSLDADAIAERRGITASELSRATTVLRSSTAIDEHTGTAKKDHRRTEERGRAGLEVTGEWSLHADGDVDLWPAVFLLQAAARLTFAIRGKRRRGGGECSVLLQAGGTSDFEDLAKAAVAQAPPSAPQTRDTGDDAAAGPLMRDGLQHHSARTDSMVGALLSALIDVDVLAVTAEFTAPGALFVADGHDGGVIKLPLVSAGESMVRFQLPGISIKGVLRSHAEMIARTVTVVDAPTIGKVAEARDGLRSHLTDPRLPAVTDLFGAVRTGDDKNGTEQWGNTGALHVNTVLSTAAVPVEQWQKLLNSATEQSARTVVAQINHSLQQQGGLLNIETRTSIDRSAGGAAEERPFASAEPHVGWQPLTLELDVAQLSRNATTYDGERKERVPDPARRDAALALLILVLLDLTEGWIRFGAVTTRGAGAISVEREAVTFTPMRGSSVGDVRGTLADLVVDGALLDRLTSAWGAQISAAEELRAQAKGSDD